VTRRLPAPLLVLAAVISVQFGEALAATLIPTVGVFGSVTLRLTIAAAVLLATVRPRPPGSCGRDHEPVRSIESEGSRAVGARGRDQSDRRARLSLRLFNRLVTVVTTRMPMMTVSD
jgi:hypothetical protein